jgi:S-formylglutathione hydrolase FrmB
VTSETVFWLVTMNSRRRFLRSFPFLLCFLSLLSFCAQPASAAGRVECAAVQSKLMGRKVNYCALLPPSYDMQKARRFSVVYYLHGLGDNEQSLLNFGGWNLVERLQEKKQIGDFIIVTPDGGRGFYVNSRDGRRPYEDFFIREFIPAIEKRYRIAGTKATRGLMGVSMGGYGALRFAFNYPQMFKVVAVHMPALFEKLPRGLTDPAALGDRFNFLNEVFGRPFDVSLWERNSPFTLAKNIPIATSPRIYFDCGNQDEYGFDYGATALHELLKSRRIAHEYHLYPGNHSPGYVAAHLDASLKFVSRAVAGTRY